VSSVSSRVVLLCACLISAPQLALSCECPSISPPLSERDALRWSASEATVVFRGIAVSVELEGPEYEDSPIVLPDGRTFPRRVPLSPAMRVTFQVRALWKGKVAPTQVVYSGPGCRALFVAGVDYIVFARPGSGSDRASLQTSACAGNESVSSESLLASALGKPRKRFESK
jgi:hypothetical protein